MISCRLRFIGAVLIAGLLGWMAGNINGEIQPQAQPHNRLLHRGLLVLASHQTGGTDMTVWCDQEFGNLLYMHIAGSNEHLRSDLRVVAGGCAADKYMRGRTSSPRTR